MPHHEIKVCPSCHSQFECKAGNITECQCSQILLSSDEAIYIENNFGGCLCLNCLKILQQEYNAVKKLLVEV